MSPKASVAMPRSFLGDAYHSASNSIDLLGSLSGHDKDHHDDCDTGINITLLLLTLLAMGVLFFTLYTKITMAGMRRKRSPDDEAEYGLGASIEALGLHPVELSLLRFQQLVFDSKGTQD